MTYLPQSKMAKRKPDTVVVVEEGAQRFVVATYADGSILKTLVDPNQKPKQKPRKPIARATPVVRFKNSSKDKSGS